MYNGSLVHACYLTSLVLGTCQVEGGDSLLRQLHLKSIRDPKEKRD